MTLSEQSRLDSNTVTWARKLAHEIFQQVQANIFGLDRLIQLCLVSYFTRGHILLEGNPGLGKTELVKTLAGAMGLDWGRIQFTPDLLPSDITGTKMPTDTNSQLRFNPGPVFTQLLLADEINRATPKTQSAMLEAMAERQVTVLGDQYPLISRDVLRDLLKTTPPTEPATLRKQFPVSERLFMVLATQNPIEQEGTFSLPEAQLDRFRFKLFVALPPPQHLDRIMQKVTDRPGIKDASGSPENQFAYTAESLREVMDLARDVPVSPEAKVHVFNLIYASNRQWECLQGLNEAQLSQLQALASLIEIGLGPRAGESLLLGAKGWWLLYGDDKEQADAKSLSQVMLPALVHRLTLKSGWEETYMALSKQSDNLGLKEELGQLKLWDYFQVKAEEQQAANSEGVARPKTKRAANISGLRLSWIELFLAHYCMLASPRTRTGSFDHSHGLTYYKLFAESLKEALGGND